MTNLAEATIELNGLLDKYWMGDNSKTNIIAICAAQQKCKDALAAPAASPLRGRDIDQKWIIDLIHNEYDPKPSDYRIDDNWNDGAEEIADQILGRLRGEAEG